MGELDLTELDFSNIRDLQNIIKSNGISKLAMGVKSFRQRLGSVGEKIIEAKKASAAKQAPVVSAPAKVEEKAAEKQAPVVSAAKSPAQTENTIQTRPVMDRTADARRSGYDNRPNYNGANGYQNRQQGGFNGQQRQGGYQNRQQGGYQQNRQGGKFVATGERKFDNNYGDRRQGSYQNNAAGGRFGKPGDRPMGGPNGQRKTFGAGGVANGPRLARPTETFDASTLAKNNTHSAPKKKSHDKGEEKKSLNKKSLPFLNY